ncbi:hypothetical protein FO519_004280 [Halicephalobus sp. NKZ332]|nr:hypothetical protein FO519_004280 [Halicephalobus sp. NKZ332]
MSKIPAGTATMPLKSVYTRTSGYSKASGYNKTSRRLAPTIAAALTLAATPSSSSHQLHSSSLVASFVGEKSRSKPDGMKSYLSDQKNQRIRQYSTTSPLPGFKRVKLPQLDPSMEKGTIISWRKKEGEKILEGDFLCEIEINKDTVKIKSPEEGYLARILFPEGSKDVRVGKLICVLVEKKSEIQDFSRFSDSMDFPETTEKSFESFESSPEPEIKVTPFAKKIAQENKLDLLEIQGSGPSGKILATDLFENPNPQFSSKGTVEGHLDLPALRGSTTKPTNFYSSLTSEIALDAIEKLMNRLNCLLKSSLNPRRLSINDFVVKAAAMACTKIPETRNLFLEANSKQDDNINLGATVATENGFITPVIHDVANMGVAFINDVISDFSSRAQSGRLEPHELQGGNFTLSSTNVSGKHKESSQISNLPQSCNLKIGKKQKKLIPEEKGFKSKWAPLEVCIALKPSTDKSKVLVSANLLFQCTEDYPQSAPNITIADYNGLTEIEVKHILELLKNKAKTLLGEQMIFTLCSTCQEYLEELNAHPKESIHDVMIKKQELMRKEQSRIRADSELREQAEVEEENRRRQTETKNRKQQEEIERQNREKIPNFKELEEPFFVETIFGEETKVYKKKNNVQKRKPSSRYCDEWNGIENSRGLLVTEWTFSYTLGRKHMRKIEVDFRPFLEKLESFVNNLIGTLKRLGEMDQSLYPYVFVLLKKTAVEPSNFNVSLLIGQAIGEDDRCITEDLHMIQEKLELSIPPMASQIVCALKWLHDRQLSHGQLATESVWKTKKSEFRVSDSLIFPELSKLCDLFDAMTDSTRAKSPSSPSNRTVRSKILDAQRRDIFSLGTLLDSITMKQSSLADDQASDFTEVLQNFIKFCQSAKSVEQLVDHKFLSLHLLPLNQLNDSYPDSDSILGFSQLENSRLEKDFYAFRHLGRGGFGQVLLARNKLDGNDYAVKVIPLNGENEQLIRKVTREANLLAKLKHEHVVRFYAAWIETVSLDNTLNSSISTKYSKRKNEEDSEIVFCNEKSFKEIEENSDIVFSNEKDFKESEEDSESNDNGPGRLWQKNFKKDEEDSESSDNGPGNLLKDTQMNWRLFRETLSGLQYIHGQGMIHRDIKPVNIFLDSNMSVKIGDFGLATLEYFSKTDPENADSSAINNASSQTKGIGTGLYIAPEVIQNTAYSKKTYDSRCDVYSVGIVLFEMFFRPLPIGMERLDILQHLRNQLIFPDDFGLQLTDNQRGNLKKLISWMMNLDPEKRPMVKVLLQHDLVPFVESEESDFQSICASNGCNDATTLKKVNEFLHGVSTNINKKMTIEEKAGELGTAAEIGQTAAMGILKFMDSMENFEELKNKFQKLLKHKSPEISNPAKIAIDEISKTLIKLNLFNLEKVSVVFDPGLAYRPNVFSDGLLYLLQAEIPFKATMKKIIILAGGRYDNFFYSQRHLNDPAMDNGYGSTFNMHSSRLSDFRRCAKRSG